MHVFIVHKLRLRRTEKSIIDLVRTRFKWSTSLSLLEVMEHSTTRLEAWCKTAVDAGSVDPLAQATVDLADLQAWRDDPDMPESDVGELASPLSCYANRKAYREDVVEESLPAFETSAGTLVAAVNGVSAFYLTNDVHKGQGLENLSFCF